MTTTATVLRARVTVPSNPDYYGSEVTNEEGDAYAEAVAAEIERQAHERFSQAEIDVVVVPETISRGNRGFVEWSDGQFDETDENLQLAEPQWLAVLQTVNVE